jgi:hypothetical protein
LFKEWIIEKSQQVVELRGNSISALKTHKSATNKGIGISLIIFDFLGPEEFDSIKDFFFLTINHSGKNR